MGNVHKKVSNSTHPALIRFCDVISRATNAVYKITSEELSIIGAQDGGKKIWIAKEVVEGEKLQVLSGKCIARRRDWY